MGDVRVITAAEDAPLFDRAQRLVDEGFAKFMDHSAVVNKYWWQLYERWPEFQFVLLGNDGAILTLGNSFPLRWNDSPEQLPAGGVEWALETAVRQNDKNMTPNLACAFQIVIDRSAQGRGLSYQAVETMKDIAARQSLSALIAPVRPNRKEAEPMTPMTEYIEKTRDDGLPVDDWLRVHVKLGGEIAGICERSFVVDADLESWRQWTGKAFDRDGPWIVSGGIVPVEVNLQEGRGLYVEPNVWIWHHVGSS